ncbi:MAG: tol-pal system protein YbgF, partial [Deltaproteobacteria bacterium]|nr:tol-pal system protein YbgF [Deltaproteobacteria bacterium]
LKDTAGELGNALKSIDERLKKLEEKEGTTKNDAAVPDATTLYLEGLDLVRVNKDYEKGLQAFERFLSLYPDHELSDNAQYWIGEAYYATGDWEKAILEFNKVIKNYPKGDKVPAALLKQAFSFERLGAMKESGILLKKVIAEHPKSTEAEIAEKHLKEPDKEGTKDRKK